MLRFKIVPNEKIQFCISYKIHTFEIFCVIFKTIYITTNIEETKEFSPLTVSYYFPHVKGKP